MPAAMVSQATRSAGNNIFHGSSVNQIHDMLPVCFCAHVAHIVALLIALLCRALHILLPCPYKLPFPLVLPLHTHTQALVRVTLTRLSGDLYATADGVWPPFPGTCDTGHPIFDSPAWLTSTLLLFDADKRQNQQADGLSCKVSTILVSPSHCLLPGDSSPPSHLNSAESPPPIEAAPECASSGGGGRRASNLMGCMRAYP
jgi:hypothetical protein